MAKTFKGKLLVIYDSKAIAETISLFGKDKIPHLKEINTPGTALTEVTNSTPDACIMCAMTGKTKAFDVCRSIKTNKSLKQIPVLILALNDNEKIKRKASDAGADLCLNLALPTADIIDHLNLITVSQSSGLDTSSILSIIKRLERAETKIEKMEQEICNLKEKQ
ncbi:MAG: PleD family two-component system response regulator [Planctomycetota bacterium]|jgi:DNA-binding response OmpR family regulator